jgi:EmrB/QacA subfamily drug resistance transporter
MSSDAANAAAAVPAAVALQDNSHPRRRVILAVVAMAQFMVMLDATVVNVALPSIQHRFGASTPSLQWVVDAYVLVFGSLLLLGGRSADILGRRRVFLSGLLVFTAASALCGSANSIGSLIGARTAQGLGAALLSPAALSIVVSVFRDPKERRMAMTIWAALAAIGGTLGVIMGGALIDVGNWRWAFWLNVPIGVLTAGMALRIVPALKPASDTQRRSFNLPTAALSAGALALLIFGLISISEQSLTSARTLVCLAVSLVLFGLLALTLARSADPLIPPKLLASGPLLLSAVGLLLVSGAMLSVFFMLSEYQQRVLGYNPLQAGLGVVGIGLPTLALFPLIPWLMTRFGPPRVYLGGAVMITIGALLLSTLPSVRSSYISGLLPGLAIFGLGLPCCFAPLNAMGVSRVPPVQSGVASGVLTAFNQTGAALGLASIVTLATSHTRTLMDSGRTTSVALTDGFSWGYTALIGVGAAMILLALHFTLRQARAEA